MKKKAEMKIIHLCFKGYIRWRIKITDPVKYAIKSLPGWFLINPLSVLSDKTIPRSEGEQIIPLSREEAIVSGSTLSILVPKGVSSEDVINNFETYLKYIRNISQQVDIPKTGPALSTESKKIKLTRPKEFIPSHKFRVRKSYLETSVTKEVLRKALGRTREDKLPIYHEIILESILAFNEDDFRKSILYAVFSIEIAVNNILEEKYLKALEGKEKRYLRIIRMNQAGGGFVKKDPIYEYLSDRDDFKQLLHERPLYLVKKSLLQDNEVLYKKCVELYRLRNHLVHKGEPKGNILLELDRENAIEAISCALNVFQWLGIKEKYAIPFNDEFI